MSWFPVGFFAPGPVELVLVGVVVLLLFGQRIPGLMRNLGRGIHCFRRELKGAEASGGSPASGPHSEGARPTR